MSINSIIKSAIGASIIASIIFSFFLQPATILLWTFAQNMGLEISRVFENRIYSGAAFGYRNEAERAFYMIYAGALWSVVLGGVATLWLASRSVDRRNKLAEFVRTSRIDRVILAVLILMLLFFAMEETLEGTLIYSSTELNASFQQRMNILSPYLNDHEKQTLISAWASMENKTDYEAVNSQLEKYASANSVKLPRILWPDVFWLPIAWR